jgi:hypothetical protein
MCWRITITSSPERVLPQVSVGILPPGIRFSREEAKKKIDNKKDAVV